MKWPRKRQQPEPLTIHFPNGPAYLHVGDCVTLNVSGAPLATLRLDGPSELTLMSGGIDKDTAKQVTVDYSAEMRYGS